MDFDLVNLTKQEIPKRYFLFSLKKFLSNMKIENEVELNLILLTPTKIKAINKKYRGKNKETDVLSFPIDISAPEDIKKIKKDDKIILGDIYICPWYIKKTYGIKKDKEFIREIQNIFLHGLIHLFGYDHKNKEQKSKWEKLTKKLKRK